MEDPAFLDRVARAYLEHHASPTTENVEAWEEVERIVHADPRRAWQVVLKLVELAASDDDTLICIGAGPLEDLLTFYPYLAGDAEAEAIHNVPLQRALSGARYWGNPYGDSPIPGG